LAKANKLEKVRWCGLHKKIRVEPSH